MSTEEIKDPSIRTRIAGLGPAAKITAGFLALAILAGGTTAIVLSNRNTSTQDATGISTATVPSRTTPSATPSTTASPATAVAEQPTPPAPDEAPAEEDVANEPGLPADTVPGTGNGPGAVSSGGGGGSGYGAAPEPAPAPVPEAPVYVPPVYVPPVVPSLPPQTLGSISTARASLGAPAFVTVTASCSLKATAWGSSLDGAEGGIQHAGVVGMIAGVTTGATYTADNTFDGRSGTLNIYRCS